MAKDQYFQQAFETAMAAGEERYRATLVEMRSSPRANSREYGNVQNTLRFVGDFDRALELCADLTRKMPRFEPYREAVLAMISAITESLETAQATRPNEEEPRL